MRSRYGCFHKPLHSCSVTFRERMVASMRRRLSLRIAVLPVAGLVCSFCMRGCSVQLQLLGQRMCLSTTLPFACHPEARVQKIRIRVFPHLQDILPLAAMPFAQAQRCVDFTVAFFHTQRCSGVRPALSPLCMHTHLYMRPCCNKHQASMAPAPTSHAIHQPTHQPTNHPVFLYCGPNGLCVRRLGNRSESPAPQVTSPRPAPPVRTPTDGDIHVVPLLTSLNTNNSTGQEHASSATAITHDDAGMLLSTWQHTGDGHGFQTLHSRAHEPTVQHPQHAEGGKHAPRTLLD